MGRASSRRAPQLAATMRRYLIQLATFLAPRSVDAADNTLRQFARWLVDNTDVAVVADISRDRHRGLQGVARRPARHQGDRCCRRTPNGNGCG